MFKSKTPKKIDDSLSVQVNQDLLVHNMPRLLSPVVTQEPKEEVTHGFIKDVRPKNNFKIIGGVIIGGGLIFVGLLVYFSYRFIIKPTDTPINNISEPSPLSQQASSSDNSLSPEISLASESIVVTSSVPIIELASSSANTVNSSTEISLQVPLLDQDNDGLNDNEEAILGTDPNSADTNNNSYQDLVEINNNYNPLGAGRLSANDNLSKYTNKNYKYEILYPKNWSAKSLNDEATIIFTAPDNSIIQVSVQDNPDSQGILVWYQEAFPDVTVTYDKLKSGSGWEGVAGEDALNFYVTDKNKSSIYVVSYIPALTDYLVYPNIFNLIVNSLNLQ